MLSSSIYTVIKHIHAFYFFHFTSGKYFNQLKDTKDTLGQKKREEKEKKAGKYFNLLKGTKNTLDKKKKTHKKKQANI